MFILFFWITFPSLIRIGVVTNRPLVFIACAAYDLTF